MFAIFPNNNIHMTFANGYTLSIAFGGGNYCENRESEYKKAPTSCKNAEVAAWDVKGVDIELPHGRGTDAGWLSPEQVAEIITYVSKLK